MSLTPALDEPVFPAAEEPPPEPPEPDVFPLELEPPLEPEDPLEEEPEEPELPEEPAVCQRANQYKVE